MLIYDGVTTRELDILASEVAIFLCIQPVRIIAP